MYYDAIDVSDAEVTVASDKAMIFVYVLAPEAEVNAADKDGRTATMWAAVAGHLTCLQLLVDKGAEVIAARKEGR